MLAVGTQDGRVRLVDSATGETQFEFQAHRKPICCLGISPDGRQLASASIDKSFLLWDLNGTGDLRVQGHDGKGTCVCETHQLLRWATVTDQCPVVGHARRVDAIAFAPGGERVATGSQDEAVMVWNTATGERCLLLLGHVNAVCAVAFSADGLVLVSGACDESVRVWDAGTGNILRVLKTTIGLVRRFRFSPDSSKLTCAWASQTGVYSRVVDLLTGTPSLSDLGAGVFGTRIIALSADGECTATAGRISEYTSDVCVTVLNSAPERSGGLRFQRTIPGHRSGPDIAWESLDPNSNCKVPHLEVAGCICARGEPHPACENVGHSLRITSLAFSLDGKAVASGSIDTTCKVPPPPPDSRSRGTFRSGVAEPNPVCFLRYGRQPLGGSSTPSRWGRAFRAWRLGKTPHGGGGSLRSPWEGSRGSGSFPW